MKNTIKSMKENRKQMFADIKHTHGFNEVSSKFDKAYCIAELLHQARNHAHLSQKEIAKRLKTTQSAVSRMESGANVSINKLQQYVEACGAELMFKIAF